MPKIMEIVARETKGKSYQTYKYSYDSLGVPSIDYDSDEKVMKWQDQGETVEHKTSINLKNEADKIAGQTPLLKYFLDGSRHVYKVDDMAYGNQVYPIIAGQVGVGCCKRINGVMSRELFYRDLVLVLPDKSDPEGWDKGYFASKLNKINESEELQRLNLQFSSILTYKSSRSATEHVKLEDLAIAKVQD